MNLNIKGFSIEVNFFVKVRSMFVFRYYLLSGSPVCETDWHKILKSSSVAAATAAAAAAGNGGAPVRKGKVGRPRRSRE